MEIDIKKIKEIFKDKVKTLYIVSIGLLCIFAYVLIFQFDLSLINKKEKRKRELSINIRKVNEIKAYQKQITTFNERAKVIKNENLFFEMVTEQAKKNNIVVDYMEPLGVSSQAGYKTSSIRVEGKSKYFDLDDFVIALEQDQSYIFIEDIKLQAINMDSLSKYKIKELYKANKKEDDNIFEKGELMASFKLTISKLNKE